MICEFCSKEFVSNSSLNYHKKTAKYCLKLQGVIEIEIKKIDKFTCKFCDKEFTLKHHLSQHNFTCRKKEIYETINNQKDELKKQFESEKEDLIKIFELELKNKEKIICDLKEQISELRGRLFTLRDDHEVIKEIAKQPKTTTNTTTNNNTLNITSCIDFENINKIKDVIENDFNINYVLDGQKGVAKFVKEKLLKDDDGNPIYICTDPSRQIFRYKDNSGEIKKDVEAKKLTTYIVDGGIKKKTVDVSSDWYTNEKGKIDMDKFNITLTPQQNILNLDGDNTGFKKELVSLIT